MKLIQNTLKSLNNTLRGKESFKFKMSYGFSFARSFLIIFILLVTTNSLSAQAKINEFSINGLYAYLGALNLQYELVGFKKYSFGINYNHFPSDDPATGTLVFFGRRYIHDEAKLLYFELHHASYFKKRCRDGNQVFNYLGPGIGAKALLEHNITVDLLIGVGWPLSQNRCKELSEAVHLRIGLSLGIRI